MNKKLQTIGWVGLFALTAALLLALSGLAISKPGAEESRVIPAPALDEQGAESEEFAEAPVDRPGPTHLGALLEQLLELRMHGEPGGRVVVPVGLGQRREQ